MENEYEVNNFDDITYFLGLELQWSPAGDGVCIGQHKYISAILERFGMNKAKAVLTPMEERYRDLLLQS
ncbi:Reverse transcriptase (RNA-dependent DNA polymerase) [Phytophthora infestans]|uniref:Reverse transcriptase (RNA-dependent DNA polymerase) n=1 Tax=Phytophthora infestans TaxID=4787 RepID=A0A833W2X2_PHYIN|nr:Reverse transcriptase (RNA-dependent DNA polymerase) [Phytophthora infestans]KAF4134318.1 Reverse transcriptase (RNA-dependent DNA polymerase) [Phytophthora infestans]